MNTILRRSLLSISVAGALYGAHAVAAPIGPGDFTAGEKANNILRLSGATSTDATVLNFFVDRCADNDTNVATASNLASLYASKAAEGAQQALLCLGRAGTNFENVRFGYEKESEAGSANGSVLISRATAQSLEWLDVFSESGTTFRCDGDDNAANTNDAGELSATTNKPKSTTLGTVNKQAIQSYTNCTTQKLFPAVAGISDVEAELLGPNEGAGIAQSQFQVMFGVPVSLNLYRALQIAQGISAKAECDTAA